MPQPVIQFVGPEIRAAIATLKAGMAGHVALFNAEPANTVDIEAPATYHFGIADDLAAHPFPQVEVAAVEGRFGEWTVDRVHADHDPTVNVVVWLQGVTGQIAPIYEQLLGMARTVIELLAEPGAWGPEIELANENGIYWRVSETIPFETDDATREVKKWLAPAFLQFKLEKIERRT